MTLPTGSTENKSACNFCDCWIATVIGNSDWFQSASVEFRSPGRASVSRDCHERKLSLFPGLCSTEKSQRQTEGEMNEVCESIILSVTVRGNVLPIALFVGRLLKASSAADFILTEGVDVRVCMKAGRDEHRAAADVWTPVNVCKVLGCLHTEKLTSCSVCK